jgi:hypothetical protein
MVAGKSSGSYRLMIEDALARSEPTAGSMCQGVGISKRKSLLATGDVVGEGEGEDEALGLGLAPGNVVT